MPFEGTTGEKMRKALLVTIIFLGLFLAVQIVTGVQGLRFIGSGIAPTNVISVSGHGEAFAVPDIAVFTFSVTSLKATVADAQAEATTKANAATAYLKEQGVDAKDIQTTDYAVNPRYEWETYNCVGDCGSGKQVLKGYEVRQTTTVKVHETAKAGTLLAGVGSKGATEVSGLSFTFDDPTSVQNEARDEAIADAKKKAEVLAKSLGVSLVRVVSFNENSSGYPEPMAYGRGGVVAMDAKAVAPEISTGQNKITNNVSITYEIR